MKKIPFEDMIEKMMDESNHNAHDMSFRLMVNNHPKLVHDNYNFPGEYVENLKTDVYTDDGRNLRMDCAQLVLPKGDVERKSTINVEHQSVSVNKEKVDVIYDYKIFLVYKRNIPSQSVVITNIDPGEKIKQFRSYNYLYEVYFIFVDKNDISKRLNNLIDIVEHEKTLSSLRAVDFTYIAIFVKGNKAKSIIEKLAELFHKINIDDSDLKLDIHYVLKNMIKYHYEDNKEKMKELLIMITKTIYDEEYDKLDFYQKLELRLKEKEQDYINLQKRSNNTLKDRDDLLKDKDNLLKDKDNLLKDKDNLIKDKDNEIGNLKKSNEDKDDLIKDKDNIIKDLTEKLSKFNKKDE